MKDYKYLFIFLLIPFSLVTLDVNCQKRGIAYGHFSPEDLAVLKPDISWWYNWSEVPESSVINVFGNYGFDFVPMTWNGNFNETKLRDYLNQHPETKFLLAFNEPNFLAQANMTPTAAANIWPRLEAIANDYHLKIVAPAVNYCGSCVQENGTTYTDPIKYLDDFFNACPGCKVDYIAFHSYMNTVSALQWYLGLFKKYNKPIWLTEFAGWEPNGNISNVNDQINFMMGAVDILEADTCVYRYAWFIGRGSGISTYPYIDILGANGQLTALGEIYKKLPVHNASQIVNIPGTIEAESYNTMSGILIERTQDISGFANVGYIDAGDWLEYRINVPQSDEYKILFRYASTSSASFTIRVDDATLLNVSIPNTGGWQRWSTTASNKINLSAGIHNLRLVANTGGFNINWLQIGDNATEIADIENGNGELALYPNPTSGLINIFTTKNIERLQIYNMAGTLIITKKFENALDLSELPNGLYILSALDVQGKLIVNRKLAVIK